MLNNQILKPAQEKELQKSFAALIKNTKTTKRQISLNEFAKWLDIAINILGGMKPVAERIDLSVNMLGQFRAIKKLTKDVQNLFAERKIDSVDAAVHLSLLDEQDQITVAKEVAKGDLNTADIRAVREFRKDFPYTKINALLERVKSSRDIKQYILEFVLRQKQVQKQTIIERFAKIINMENIVSLSLKGSIGTITITASGKKKLEQFAKSEKMTKSKVTSLIVQGVFG